MPLDYRQMTSRVPYPCLDEDANTVSHVIVSGTSISDTKGNSWALTGTVPISGKQGKRIPRIGPVSAGSYYSLGAGNDVLDFTGDFSIYFVFTSLSFVALRALMGNGTSNIDGYFIQLQNKVRMVCCHAAADISAITANSPVALSYNVGMVGRSGGNVLAKCNLGTIVSAPGSTPTAATTTRCQIMNDSGAGGLSPSDEIYLHEMLFTTTTPTDANFIAVANKVKNRLRIKAW